MVGICYVMWRSEAYEAVKLGRWYMGPLLRRRDRNRMAPKDSLAMNFITHFITQKYITDNIIGLKTEFLHMSICYVSISGNASALAACQCFFSFAPFCTEDLISFVLCLPHLRSHITLYHRALSKQAASHPAFLE